MPATRRPTDRPPLATVPTADPAPEREHIPTERTSERAHPDPVVALLIDHLGKTGDAASNERKVQTEQFTGALDKLGGRFETKMDAQTNAMTKGLYAATIIVVVTLVILGSIAGAVTYFKGGGFEAGSNTAPSSAPSNPVPANP
ncbi:MAG: hypothetical protein EPN91_06970 [Salinibacterium sp.]|nr:MAG: hypothetical protein EPN91_06970 [Salinibacterium sp.]